MATPVPPRPGRRAGSWLVVGCAVLALAGLVGWQWSRQGAPPGIDLAAAALERSCATVRRPPPMPSGPPARAWGEDIKVRTIFQQPIDRLPESPPYVFRVTELEMEPGTRIFEHRQLSVGAHLVVRGMMQIEDLDANREAVYGAGQAYFEGLGPLHRASNPGAEPNRVLMFDVLPASRGFDGTQQFTSRGRHNEGELRSGPYVQVPLDELSAGQLMLRVTELSFGPKAKTEEHVRLGPALYFVAEGTATIRKDWDNSSMTYGTNGYFFENGREAHILENKPPTPARFIAVELLPTTLGNAPSSIPTR